MTTVKIPVDKVNTLRKKFSYINSLFHENFVEGKENCKALVQLIDSSQETMYFPLQLNCPVKYQPYLTSILGLSENNQPQKKEIKIPDNIWFEAMSYFGANEEFEASIDLTSPRTIFDILVHSTQFPWLIKKISSAFESISHRHINQAIEEWFKFGSSTDLEPEQAFFLFSGLGHLQLRANDMRGNISLDRKFHPLFSGLILNNLKKARKYCLEQYPSPNPKWKDLNLIKNREEFDSNLSQFIGDEQLTQKVLTLMRNGWAILAGGSLLSILTSQLRGDSDLDLWILNRDEGVPPTSRDNIIQTLFNDVSTDIPRSVTDLVETLSTLDPPLISAYNSVINLGFPQSDNQIIEIQVIYSAFSTGEDLVSCFDMTHIESYYDGDDLYLSPLAYYSWVTGKFYPTNDEFIREYRIKKSYDRGFFPQQKQNLLEEESNSKLAKISEISYSRNPDSVSPFSRNTTVRARRLTKYTVYQTVDELLFNFSYNKLRLKNSYDEEQNLPFQKQKLLVPTITDIKEITKHMFTEFNIWNHDSKSLAKCMGGSFNILTPPGKFINLPGPRLEHRPSTQELIFFHDCDDLKTIYNDLHEVLSKRWGSRYTNNNKYPYLSSAKYKISLKLNFDITQVYLPIWEKFYDLSANQETGTIIYGSALICPYTVGYSDVHFNLVEFVNITAVDKFDSKLYHSERTSFEADQMSKFLSENPDYAHRLNGSDTIPI